MIILTRAFKSPYTLRLHILSAIILFSFFLLVGCSTLQLNSNIRDREVTVDGKNSEWLGAMYYFRDENISVGFLNDDNYIFICMIAEEPLIRAQMMMQGFTLWFDPTGGKEKTFGIKFPIGMQGREGRDILIGMRERELDLEELREAFEQSLDELEILVPKKDIRKRIPVKEVKGIEIDLESSSGLLVYELKVPLLYSEQYPYAVGAEEGDLIGIGMVIPRMDMNAMRKRMGGRGPGEGGMPGGGRGGMGGMPGGRGMMGGRRPQMPNGLKIWMAVQLASDNSSVPEVIIL